MSDAANARFQCIGVNIAERGEGVLDMVVFMSDPGIKSPMRENIHTQPICQFPLAHRRDLFWYRNSKSKTVSCQQFIDDDFIGGADIKTTMLFSSSYCLEK